MKVGPHRNIAQNHRAHLHDIDKKIVMKEYHPLILIKIFQAKVEQL